jgi:transcriptional regulator with XRE-family HTH domain
LIPFGQGQRKEHLKTGRALGEAAQDLPAIGRRLQAARRLVGLRQRDLAAACLVTPNAVTNWEAGTRRPKVSELARLLPMLGVDLDWLYLGDDRGLNWEKREALARTIEETAAPGCAPIQARL